MDKKIITNLLKLILSASFIFSSNLAALEEPLDESEQKLELEPAHEHDLNFKKGKIFILGHLAFNYELTERSSPPQHKFGVNSDVGLGYFFFDRIAIGASLPLKLTLWPTQLGRFGLAFFATYFFKFNSLITPYAGLDITPAYSVNEQALRLAAGINAGVLISLSSNLALDFGLAPEIHLPLNNRQRWKLEVPIGFAGMRAFF